MPLSKRAIIEVMEKHKNTNYKPVLSSSKWIEFYSELASELTEEFSLDPVWTEDEFGTEVLTESGQDNYMHIAGIVEEHMEKFFIKGA